MGKTAVFVLATLHQLTPVTGECHVVVLCHTRSALTPFLFVFIVIVVFTFSLLHLLLPSISTSLIPSTFTFLTPPFSSATTCFSHSSHSPLSSFIPPLSTSLTPSTPPALQFSSRTHRELAFQIQKEYERFSKYLPDVKSKVFYGGTYAHYIRTLRPFRTYMSIYSFAS